MKYRILELKDYIRNPLDGVAYRHHTIETHYRVQAYKPPTWWRGERWVDVGWPYEQRANAEAAIRNLEAGYPQTRVIES